MTIEGTVVNGVIVLDGTPKLPEGVRVRVEFAEADLDDIAPPPTGKTREELLTSLRESVAEAKAGRGGVDARQFLKELVVSKFFNEPRPRQ